MMNMKYGRIAALVPVFLLLATLHTTALSVGDRVRCIQNLNVRSTPSTSGTLVTTEASGSQGTISSGPQSGSGYTWWYVNWDNGYSGWAVQDYMVTIYTATIASSNPSSGVYIYVGPNDILGRADGTTSFSRVFDSGTSVTLIAPLTAGGNNFQKWQRNGSDLSFSTTVTFSMSGTYTLTVVYVAAPPITHTLTVASSNPSSGVSITANQPDNGGNYGGSTSFSRTFNNNASVSFNAPSTASGNNFQKWQKDGVDLTTSTTASVTMDANHTITAVYVSPPTTYTLNVASSNPNSGVYVYVGPNDTLGRADGTTAFSRTFYSGTSITLIAPLTASGNNFQKWQRDGVDLSFSTTVNFSMGGNYTLTAVYVAAPPVTHTLTVASLNPNSGVSITANQPDNGGNYGGSTSFSRTFNNNASVSFNAPSTAGGNNFQKWQKDGVDLTTSATATVTMDADHTITAVYLTPVIYTVTIASSNPNSGVYVYVGPNDVNGQADGTSSFTRQFYNGTSVTLIAPTTTGGNNFTKWTLNGADYDVSRTTTFAIAGNCTMTAVFSAAPPVTRTLSVASSNPNSGVSITGYQLDNNNNAGGTTAFARVFNQNASVLFSAPASAGGNSFQKWQKDGVDLTASSTASVTMDADHTITAIYGVTALTVIMTSPVGGESWVAGSAHNITWTASGSTAQISYYNMDYSLDGGSSWWTSAFYAAGSATSASWAIPANLASTQARVRLRALSSGGSLVAPATSANNFTILSPAGNATAYPTCDNRAPLSGSQVNFTESGSTSSGPGCSISSYSWAFGDGGTSAAANPSHTFYSASGSTTTYTVSLQVTDSCGKTDTRYLSICVTGQALGNNSQQPFSRDPVNLATGNYTYNHVDLRIPGRGLPVEFKRFYNSKDTTSGGLPLGFGWTHSYNIYLSISASNSAAVIAFGDGHRETYSTNGAGGYVSEVGVFNSLTGSAGTFTLTTKEQQKYGFDAQGKLSSLADKNSNTLAFAYSGGNLTTITDTVGRAITFSNNANGCLAQITDALGRNVRFAYDANTNLIGVTDLRSNLTQFGYDGYHQVTNAVDARANTFVSMVYDTQRRVVSSQKDALLSATTFDYDFVNRITTVTDAYTNKSYNYYDDRLRVVKTVDNLGNSQNFEYDTNNNRTKVVDKNGKATTYAYDGNGNVIWKTDPLANTTLVSYDASNNPTNRVDALSGLALFRYDLKGNLTNTLNALGKTNAVKYDAFGLPVLVVDANGQRTTNTYDSFGNLVKIQDALGGSNTLTFDAVGRKLSQADALGGTNLFFYDSGDNLIARVDAMRKTNSFTFDGNNNRVTSADYLGNTTTNVYDQKDRLIIVRDAMGGSVTNDYDKLDRKVRLSDARGGVTQYRYDLVGNLIAATNAVGGGTRYTYDQNGNRTSATDPKGNVTTNVFDDLNRVVFTRDALLHSTTTVYDALGRIAQNLDALNRTNWFGYDALGRLTAFTNAAGGVVRHTYDNVGNRTSTTDPNGHTTTNVFNGLNRLVASTDPSAGLAQFGYDVVGNLTNRTDPNGKSTICLYDANNRRTIIGYPTGTPVSFGYDGNGNRTGVTNALGASVYRYDALNRMTNATDCYGKTVTYGYDRNGNRTSVTYPGGKTVTYSFDAINRMKTVTDWLNHTTTYVYDPNSNMTDAINPNGTAAACAYDGANRLVSLTNSAPGSTVICGYQYTLDAVGNHVQVGQVEPLQTTPIMGQVSYAYDNDNRMVTSEGLSQAFDANGNMTSISTTNLLVYDYENRLTQTVFAGSTNAYQYDGLGNRMSATRDGSVTRHVVDANGPLTQVLAETDSGGTVTAYYVYGLGLIAMIDPAGNPQYYHYDSRGSTIALTDASGNIMEAYAYDPFGRPINASLSDNRFRYLGRHGVVDEENGLNYIRARYYSTRRGRFVTKDPTGGRDGDSQSLNRYIYALNNPVRLIDISGLSSQDPGSAQNTAGSSDTSSLHNLMITIASPGSGPSGAAVERVVSVGYLVAQFGSMDNVLKYLNATAKQGAAIKVAGRVLDFVVLGQDISEQWGSVRDVRTFASASQAVAANFLLDFTQVSTVGTLFWGNDFHVTGNDLEQAERASANAIANTEVQAGTAIGQPIFNTYMNGLNAVGSFLGTEMYYAFPSLF